MKDDNFFKEVEKDLKSEGLPKGKPIYQNYRLLKDMPWVEAGEIFRMGPDNEYFFPESNEFINTIHNLIHKDWVIDNLEWFEPVPKFSPLLGEWVFNEITKTAMKIVNHEDMKSSQAKISENYCFRLVENECTPQAVKDNPKVYTRYPTDTEVAISCMNNYVIRSISGNFQVLKITKEGTIYNKSDNTFYGNINDLYHTLVGDQWEKITTFRKGDKGSQKITVRTFSVGCQEYNVHQLEDLMNELVNYNACIIEENKKKK
jgi:hypothetical protein